MPRERRSVVIACSGVAASDVPTWRTVMAKLLRTKELDRVSLLHCISTAHSTFAKSSIAEATLLGTAASTDADWVAPEVMGNLRDFFPEAELYTVTTGASGSITQAILDVVHTRLRPDLLVLGSRGLSGLARLAAGGSKARAIARQSDVACLVVNNGAFEPSHHTISTPQRPPFRIPTTAAAAGRTPLQPSSDEPAQLPLLHEVRAPCAVAHAPCVGVRAALPVA